jgi:hypothetical protein
VDVSHTTLQAGLHKKCRKVDAPPTKVLFAKMSQTAMGRDVASASDSFRASNL